MAAHRDACLKAWGERWLVITTDNSAAIGRARQDVLAVDPYLVGRLTARVAAMEAVALGAAPLAVSSTLSFDYGSMHGQQITRGILDLMAELGLLPQDLTGSCETNFPAQSTCLGVTMVATAERDQLLVKRVEAGDCCYLLGMPVVGEPVLHIWSTLITPAQVQELVNWPEVHEVLPVGSHGVRQELLGLAEAYQLEFYPFWPPGFGWDQPAGPATCVLVAGEADLQRKLRTFGQSVTLLGHWQQKTE